jgi:tRNA A-37 threonylcarbamoyl transferase component Bud32
MADANYTVEKEPDNAFAFYNRAFAQSGLGDRDGAVDSLRRAAELDGRFEAVYEQAAQAPKTSDLLFLFDDVAPKASGPIPGARNKRFARVTLLSVLGGVLIALGLLHILSPRWRRTLAATMRRLTGAGVEGSEGGGFWSGYTVTRQIGSGGMGVVYEAVDNALARKVAIKKMRDEIRADPAELRRFISEARIVAALHHPNIVDIYSIVEDPQDLYLVFEFVDGKTVADLLRENGPLSWDRSKRVMTCACAAAAYAHERGIIHRDIKPSNIMVSSDGQVKVMDFGVARMAKDAMTKAGRTNTIAGTPAYMAPEAEEGAVGPQSDIFSLGVCWYEMLSGRLPFSGDGVAMLLNKMNGKIAPLSQAASLPAGINAVLAKALAPNISRRYVTAREFSAALDALPG